MLRAAEMPRRFTQIDESYDTEAGADDAVRPASWRGGGAGVRRECVERVYRER